MITRRREHKFLQDFSSDFRIVRRLTLQTGTSAAAPSRNGMVRPLQKHTMTGDRYSRLPAVETAIVEALTLDWSALRARASIANRESPQWLPSECLVYLIRQAVHTDDDKLHDLVEILFDRCARNLSWTLNEDRIPNTAEVHTEILSQLGELFARDLVDDSNRLDYYEVRFDSAFARLRSEVVRAELRRSRPLRSLSDVVHDLGESEVLTGTESPLQQRATQETTVYSQQMIDAIYSLPERERDALLYVRVLGYPVESDDPDKPTAASILGVSSRTVRSRISRALQRLRKFQETS